MRQVNLLENNFGRLYTNAGENLLDKDGILLG